MLPRSSTVFAGPERVTYEKLRSSWLIVKRETPAVPCPTNTVMPRRNMSKDQHAKLFSIYLRPWTLSEKLGSADVPFAGKLGLATCDSPGTVRTLWKQYLQEVWHHAVSAVRNFMSNSMARSHRDLEDEGDTRGPAMTCAMTLQDIEKVLAGDKDVKKHDTEESQDMLFFYHGRRVPIFRISEVLRDFLDVQSVEIEGGRKRCMGIETPIPTCKNATWELKLSYPGGIHDVVFLKMVASIARC